MAFATTNNKFQRIGAQNDLGPTLWSYLTADALTTVDGSGYFNAVADRLKVGDFIFVKGATAGITVVTSNTRDLTASPAVFGVVDVSNFTTIGAVNSD